MDYVFSDLITKRILPWFGLFCFVQCIALIALTFIHPNFQLSDNSKALIVIIAYFGLILFFVPALINAARQNHKHILTVLIWSLVLVISFIVASIYVFMLLVTDTLFPKYDKLLNLLPVVLAIWGAAVGWLVHLKVSTKAHRTNNALSIIMETTKSAEFLRCRDVTSKHFPAGMASIPTEYHQYFSTLSCSKVMKNKATTPDEIEHVGAIRATKYVLNYYEFMAVGIEAGDLDDKLLFDTLSHVVIGLYDRSKLLVEYMENPVHPGGDPSTWCELKALVKRWNNLKSDKPENRKFKS